jgi:hypothetical protein
VDHLNSHEWMAVLVSVQVERELIPLGKALPLTATERQHGLMKIVSDYCRVIRQAVRGDYRDPVRHPATRRADQGAVHRACQHSPLLAHPELVSCPIWTPL